MESQTELLDDIRNYVAKFGQELPATMSAHTAFSNEVYKDGALSHKVKRLMALAIALRAGCTACILAQTKGAVDAGATRAEVLETVSLAIGMGGTPALGWSWRVVKMLDELGK